MDREVLEKWLASGFSLQRMGRLAGRSPSTISYWLTRHGLVPPGHELHAARGGLDRALLADLVERGLTQREIAVRVDRSVGTVCHWLREYGLRTRRARDGATPREPRARFEAQCATHGTTLFVARADGSPRCLACRAAAVTARRRRVKAMLVADAGGACCICGYDRHPAALHFHHVRPGDKCFSIAEAGLSRSLEKARAEAAKCVLLCSNCHAEVECGAADLPASILGSPARPGSRVPG